MTTFALVVKGWIGHARCGAVESPTTYAGRWRPATMSPRERDQTENVRRASGGRGERRVAVNDVQVKPTRWGQRVPNAELRFLEDL